MKRVTPEQAAALAKDVADMRARVAGWLSVVTDAIPNCDSAELARLEDADSALHSLFNFYYGESQR